jgi:hypothetical protein
MPRIITSNKPITSTVSTLGCEGQLRWGRHGQDDFPLSALHSIPLPTGTQGVDRRPSWFAYNNGARGRFYGAGAWTANILIDEHLRCLREGIPAFTGVPAVVPAAGPGVTGTSICFLRPLDYLGQRKGRLSASVTVTLANQQRQWGPLPTTHPDPSVSYIEGLVSHDGGVPRVAWTRQLGVTTVTEGLATGELGEAHSNDFVAIPLCTFHVAYHDRKAASGHPQFPEVVYLSDEMELERHSGLILRTDGDTVKGLFVQNDTLYFGSPWRIYRANGYTISDFTREIDKPDIGLLGHHGIVNAFKRTILPTTKGFYLHDGAYHFITDDRQKEFVREAKLYRSDYENAQGIYDPVTDVYLFGPVRHSVISGGLGETWVKWVLDGERLFPELEAGEFSANWANDKRGRQDTTSVVFTLPSGGSPLLATGSRDGNLRQENVEDNLDDDQVFGGKETVIEPATFMPNPGGTELDGHTWHKAITYMECDRGYDDPSYPVLWRVEFRAGGEHCQKRVSPDYVESNTGDFEELDGAAEPNTSHPHVLEGVAGAAMSLRVIIHNGHMTKDKWRGCYVTYGPGVTTRGFISEEDGTILP